MQRFLNLAGWVFFFSAILILPGELWAQSSLPYEHLEGMELDEDDIPFVPYQTIRKEIDAAPPLTAEQLCAHKWETTLAISQTEYESDPKPISMSFDIWHGNTYTFLPDGTFQVDAILDTDGRWELRDGGKVLYLYNNFREDEELHHLILRGDRLEFYYIFSETNLLFQFMRARDHD